jgi:hypothetical protein
MKYLLVSVEHLALSFCNVLPKDHYCFLWKTEARAGACLLVDTKWLVALGGRGYVCRQLQPCMEKTRRHSYGDWVWGVYVLVCIFYSAFFYVLQVISVDSMQFFCN